MTAKADEMKERKALSGSTSAMTLHSRAVADLELEATAGRHSKASIVSGATPTVQYPRLPASSPWAADMVPPEEPLGYSVNDLSPTGELHELAGPAGSDIGSHLPDVVETTGPAIPALAASPAPMVEAPVPPLPLSSGDAAIPKLKRRKIAA